MRACPSFTTQTARVRLATDELTPRHAQRHHDFAHARGDGCDENERESGARLVKRFLVTSDPSTQLRALRRTLRSLRNGGGQGNLARPGGGAEAPCRTRLGAGEAAGRAGHAEAGYEPLPGRGNKVRTASAETHVGRRARVSATREGGGDRVGSLRRGRAHLGGGRWTGRCFTPPLRPRGSGGCACLEGRSWTRRGSGIKGSWRKGSPRPSSPVFSHLNE